MNAPDPTKKPFTLKNLKLQTIALVALIALFGAYLFANVFVRYAADDYCIVRDAQQLGIGFVHYFYQTWSANVTDVAVLSVMGQLEPAGPSGLWTALILVAWLIALYALVRHFLPEDALLVSLILIIAILDTAPQLGESFYWQTGITYSLSIVVLCVLGWWLFTRSDRFAGWLGTALLAFFTVTTSEVFILLLFVLLAFVFWKIPSARRRSVAGLIGTTIGTGLLIFAPGTAIRAAAFPKHNLITSVYYSVIRAGVPLYDALRHGPAVLVAIVAVLVCIGAMSRRGTPQVWMSRRDRSRIIMEMLLVIIGVSILTEFTGFYATGGEVAGRAEIIPITLTLAGLCVISLQFKRPNWLQSGRLVGIVFVVFVIVSAVRAGGFIAEISGDAAQWDARDQALKSGSQAIQPVYFFDLQDVETDWVNACIREYYGLKTS